MRLLKDFLAKKERLGADSWGGTDGHIRDVVGPLESLLAREFPDFNPYPWGPQKWAARLRVTSSFPRLSYRSSPSGSAESHPLRRANWPDHSAGSHVPGAPDWSRRSASNSPKGDAPSTASAPQ